MSAKVKIIVIIALFVAWEIFLELTFGAVIAQAQQDLVEYSDDLYLQVVENCMELGDTRDDCMRAATSAHWVIFVVNSPVFSAIATAASYLGIIRRIIVSR
jgi:hypothetical protein